MHKSSTRFFMMSLMVAVVATGCASKKGATADTSTDTSTGAMSAGGQRQSGDFDVSGNKWAMVDPGPLTVNGVVGVGHFNGEAQCYASAGPTCGNSSSGNLGTRVFSCTSGGCAAENGGQVASGQILCCGPMNGNGGKLRVTYTK